MKCISVLGLTLLMFLGSSDAGVSYVRWGRTTCPDKTVALYKGYMAGGHYAKGGSGGNYLCMNENPQFVNGKPGRQGISAAIFGFEYEVVSHFQSLFSMENIPDGTMQQEDVPCVVCYVQGSYDKILMPGRQDCDQTGYDLQYKGYLMAELNSGRARGEYICLDSAPEGRTGGSANNNEGAIYPVQLGCGSLPCNPFVDGMEVTCAVCTF